MNRRQFILAGLGTPAISLHPASEISAHTTIVPPAPWLIGATSSAPAGTQGTASPPAEPWINRLRWAQLAFVENDPKHFDPDFWLDYFRRIHADGALLSAGGVVAFYPTDIPFHHRSDWLGNSDP